MNSIIFRPRVIVGTLILASLFFIFSTTPVSAQSGLVPCGHGVPCDGCHFVELGNKVLSWLIGVLMVVFAIIAAYAGFKLVTSAGNVQAKTDAKSKLVNAIIGLIVVLAGWLLIDTVMKGLLKGSEGKIEGYGPWSKIECGVSYTGYVREGSDADDSSQALVLTSYATPGSMTHDQAVATLGPNIAIHSSGGCTDRSISTCTSLDGVQPNTIQRIADLQVAVGAPIVITGGTETGHSAKGDYTHGNGYKIDLRTTPKLNEYIASNFEELGGGEWKDSRGNIYHRHEPDHWDVTITN